MTVDTREKVVRHPDEVCAGDVLGRTTGWPGVDMHVVSVLRSPCTGYLIY